LIPIFGMTKNLAYAAEMNGCYSWGLYQMPTTKEEEEQIQNF